MSNTTEPFDPELCTLATCSVEEFGQIQYIPTLAGNTTYLAIFAVLFFAQGYLGIRHKTWGYLTGMLAGIALEIVGYAGRLMLHDNIFDSNNFIIYLIGLTIGPAFLTAAIYLCLGRIITIFGVSLSVLRPKWITILFVGCDFISLLLQAVGGAITSTADDAEGNQLGIDIMIAGLASQVVSLVLFIVICAHFGWMVFKHPNRLEAEYEPLRKTYRFQGMLWSIGISVVTILIRSIFRLIELQEGFNGELANNELDFMILEGPMIFIAVILLTIWHPGWVLGHTLWVDAGFKLRPSNKNKAGGKRVYSSVDTSESDSRIPLETV